MQVRVRPAGQQPWVVLELEIEILPDLPAVTDNGEEATTGGGGEDIERIPQRR